MLYKTMYLKPGRRALALVIGAGLVLLAAIFSFTMSASAATAHASSKTKTTTVETSSASSLGKFKFLVVAGSHNSKRTVYMLKSGSCTGSCATAWPAFTVKSGKIAGKGGANSKKFSINKKSHQVSYYGHKLYYFTSDTKADPVSGEGISNFYVIGPKGKAVLPSTGGPGGGGPGY
jgi:predicted lipoprotein with Yx(FWY)xxD motif